MPTKSCENDQSPVHLLGLLRHFADLPDGTHGDGAINRADKEQLFAAAVGYLDPFARQTLPEMNETLLLGSGTITSTGIIRSPNGDSTAIWTLAGRSSTGGHLSHHSYCHGDNPLFAGNVKGDRR